MPFIKIENLEKGFCRGNEFKYRVPKGYPNGVAQLNCIKIKGRLL